MLALITGASSGIGKDMAKYLSQKGYDLIITARDEDKLNKLKEEIKTKVEIIIADLSKEEEVYNLCNKIKNIDIDVFINNAGFGVIGEFWKTDIEKEINMLKVNDMAMHILFKEVLKGMIDRDSGYILNVASLAGFMPGPLMSAYYATKSYIVNLTRGVQKEVKKYGYNVQISVLCPGPIDTDFLKLCGVEFSIKPMKSEYVSKYSIDKLLNKKDTIVPGIFNKCAHIMGKIFPSKLVSSVTYKIQKSKNKNNN